MAKDKRHLPLPLVAAFACALIGISFLIFAKATTPSYSLEPENGTTTGPLSIGHDTTASGGGLIHFGSGAPQTDVVLKDTNYAIPMGAKFLSPNGADTGAGTEASPYKTLAKAVAATGSGGTIVIRGGTYRLTSRLDISNKALTLQSYPHEKVWIKGSTVVSGFVQEGSVWRKDNWNYTFPLPREPRFVDGQYPMAGHPDMVFVGGKPLAQVNSKAAVSAGEFYVDETGHHLYIGENPSGKEVEGSILKNLVLLNNASGSKLLGLGFAHAASQTDSSSGAVTVAFGSNNVLVENNVFAYNAATGFEIGQSSNNVTARSNDFLYNGITGAQSWGNPSNLLIENNRFAYNNFEHFAVFWGAGGMKMISIKNSTIRGNIVESNNATGIWCDISCSNTTIARNTVRNNAQYGIMYEISDGAIIASNLVVNNGNGIYVSESPNVKVYNNSVVSSKVANARSLDVNTNSRKTTTGTVIVNNVFSQSVNSNTWVVRVQDDGTKRQSGDQMVSAMNNNAYYRRSSTSPSTLIRWSKPGGVDDYATLTPFHQAHNKELTGILADNQSTDPFFTNESVGDYTARAGSLIKNKGQQLPADILAAINDGLPYAVISAGNPLDIGAIAWPR